jgi:Glycoside hydrolase family 127 C-terminal domain
MKGYRFAGCALIATVVGYRHARGVPGAAGSRAVEAGSRLSQRGPLVYAVEWPDNPDGHVRNLRLSDDEPLSSEFRATLLNGVEVIAGHALAYFADRDGRVHSRRQALVAIPYYGWANRGTGEMTVWIANAEKAIRPQPAPTLASERRHGTWGVPHPRGLASAVQGRRYVAAGRC